MSERERDSREAMDRLNQANRVLSEARMLPTNKPLTAEQTSGVITSFRAYLRDRGIRLAQVAREISRAESCISSWQNRNYTGDNDELTRVLNAWIERDARRTAAEKPKTSVNTWVAATIRTVALQADKQNMMAAIVAPAGVGKTMVLQALTQEMRGVYLYCHEGLTPREFLCTLAEAVAGKHNASGQGRRRTEAGYLRAVVNSLQGTRRIIFLDEAHQLTKAVRVVRSIHDQAGVPIIMAGTADILRYVDDRTDGRGQFSSRTIRCNILDFVNNAEYPDGNPAGRDLFSIEEIRDFFAKQQIRMDDGGMRLMWALACLPNFGTLRLIRTVAAVAADLSTGEALTRQQLLSALQLVVGGEAKYLRSLADKHEEHSTRRVAAVA